MGPRFPPGLHQPKWKDSCPSQWPLCGNPMTPSHLPDTRAMPGAICHLALQMLPSTQPTRLICISCLAPPGTGVCDPVLRVLQNQLLLNSIWWWRQIFHIQTSSTAFPWDAQTMLLSRIGANSFEECPLIKRRSNLAQVFLRGYTICHVKWMCIFYFESILYSKRNILLIETAVFQKTQLVTVFYQKNKLNSLKTTLKNSR